MNIQLIICDFDGTLVDTQEANYYAYREVLLQNHIILERDTYNKVFGMRLNEFMKQLNIHDTSLIEAIKTLKAEVYPKYFGYIKKNESLFAFIKSMKANGLHIALASTAQKTNINNILNYLNEADCFDLIITGEDISNPKPNPECFHKIMQHFSCQPNETIIFEDSTIGLEAAKSSQANYIKIEYPI